MLERIVVTGGVGYLVVIGSDFTSANVVDGLIANTQLIVSQSDAWPWRLGEQDNFWIWWTGTPTPPNLPTLVVQARIEAAR